MKTYFFSLRCTLNFLPTSKDLRLCLADFLLDADFGKTWFVGWVFGLWLNSGFDVLCCRVRSVWKELKLLLKMTGFFIGYHE